MKGIREALAGGRWHSAATMTAATILAAMLAGSSATWAFAAGARQDDAQAAAARGQGAGAAGSPGQLGHAVPERGVARPTMPSPSLEPPADQVPVLMAYGQGVQRYVCTESKETRGAFEWVLKEPQAKLADAEGREIGTHSAGPTWQLADGSKAVKKKLVASYPALASDAIPWLLVEIESSGTGRLTGTRYVQRVDTVGGMAPATGCNSGHPGATHDVEYRATYVFYAPRQAP